MMFICITFAIHLPGNATANEAQIKSAIETYAAAMEETDLVKRRQQFAKAEQLFRQAVEGTDEYPPMKNPDLLINLGNSAIQCEHLGTAIAAYRQALVLEPMNSKASQNLAYARSILPEWIQLEVNTGLADSLFFWKDAFSMQSISLAAAICFAISVLFFVLGVIRRQNLLRNLAVLPLLLWLVLLSAFFSTSFGQPNTNLVITSDTNLYSADSENSPVRVSRPLPSGAEATILQERGRWFEIQIPGNVSGWILKSKAVNIEA